VALPNTNQLAVLDTSDNSLLHGVPIGDDPIERAIPNGVAVAPDGSRIYVANTGTDEIWVLDAESLEALPPIPLGKGAGPVALAMDPDGDRLYSADINSDEVSVIDPAAGTVFATVAVGSDPTDIAIGPEGRLFVPNQWSNDVSVVDPKAAAVVATIPVAEQPTAAAVRGDRVYVADGLLEPLVTVIDSSSNQVIQKIEVEIGTRGITTSPTAIYVCGDDQPFEDAGSVTVLPLPR
jgi:YVTN family beta-propeller protein